MKRTTWTLAALVGLALAPGRAAAQTFPTDLRNNATLAAMLAYMTSEDPERVPNDTRVLPTDPPAGVPSTWPPCREPRRSWN